jgi:hypothetical protein
MESEMTAIKHTPLPWAVHPDSPFEIMANDGDVCPLIATVNADPDSVSHEQATADAEIICRAVNNHAVLIRAIKDCLIVMHQADAGDTTAADLAREALASVGEKEERPVLNYMAGA